ncbi:MAG: ribonuclease PH [Spartobacteria bacterium]|nr:ribonuclease PH [Spartobacteria bacterium]
MDAFIRSDNRTAGMLRPAVIKLGVAPAATGSVLISVGNTQVICSASIDDQIPRWMRLQQVPGGWLSAEYSLMPCSTAPRSRREVNSGKPSGRTQEIQRLIGRSLRAVVDLNKLDKKTIWIDCDVLQADGGTRTASITGAYVALKLAVQKLMDEGVIAVDPVIDSVAAVSVGIVETTPLLDLCYEEDRRAEVDMNVVMTGSGRFVEVQGSAEGQTFSADQLQAMLGLANEGIGQLSAVQNAVLGLE